MGVHKHMFTTSMLSAAVNVCTVPVLHVSVQYHMYIITYVCKHNYSVASVVISQFAKLLKRMNF